MRRSSTSWKRSGASSHVDGRRRSVREIVEGDRFFQRAGSGELEQIELRGWETSDLRAGCSRDFREYEAQSPLNRNPGAAVSTSSS